MGIKKQNNKAKNNKNKVLITIIKNDYVHITIRMTVLIANSLKQIFLEKQYKIKPSTTEISREIK